MMTLTSLRISFSGAYIGQRVIFHAFGKVDGVQDLDAVGLIDDLAVLIPHRLSVLVPLRPAMRQEFFPVSSKELPFGIGDHIGAVHLEQGWLDKEPCLAAAGAADDQDIFISCRFRILRAAGHGEAFRPGQRDVPIGNGVYVGRDIRRRAPAGRAVFDTLAVFLGVLALDIHRQPDENRAEDTDADIQRMKAGCGAGKCSLEALPDMQQLFRGVKPRHQPHRLAELVKEIHEEQIRQVWQKIFLSLSFIAPCSVLWS